MYHWPASTNYEKIHVFGQIGSQNFPKLNVKSYVTTGKPCTTGISELMKIISCKMLYSNLLKVKIHVYMYM